MKQSMINAASGGAFIEKSPEEARDLISKMVANSIIWSQGRPPAQKGK